MESVTTTGQLDASVALLADAQAADPLRAARRAARRERRLPLDAACTCCGERAACALVAGSTPLVCRECHARAADRSTVEAHHPAGRRNSAATILLPANEHSLLSDYQQDWPIDTLRNPDGSPLLRAAAAIRGWLDALRLLLERVVGWVPAYLEALDAWLRQAHGAQWWRECSAWAAAEPEGGIA